MNEITLCASWQGRDASGVACTILIQCPTAPGVTAKGESSLAVDRRQPFARRVLTLEFPPDAARRVHKVWVRVLDTDAACVFAHDIRFAKAYAWAFLGPFWEAGRRGRPRSRVAEADVEPACDPDPMRLAALADLEELGLSRWRADAAASTPGWQIVANGSCCDWTGAVDLRKVYGLARPAFAYAVTWIHAETHLAHRSFTFQCDDSGWLWVNGRFVASMPVGLPKEAQRLWTSARLTRGPNPVVTKVTQDKRYWGFRFDVVDWHYQGRRGDVVTGVEPRLWPGSRGAR